MPVIGSITKSRSRIARETRPANESSRPSAASRDSEGKTTMPSGTPITPIGIWSSVNATLNADTAPWPSVDAIEVTTTNVICPAPRPSARGAIRASACRASGSWRSIVRSYR